jgi:hypothetical protein
MILKKVFQSKENPSKVTKNPLIKAEALGYKNGQKRPVGQQIYKQWINQISALRNVLGTTSELASGASIKFYKVDTKGKKKLILNPKQFDTMFMNDIDDVSSFLYNYFGQIKTYDNVFIIPEESKYPYRKGKIDFFIADNTNWYANPNETGKQTIDSFTYRSNQGIETQYKYEDVIYIRKPLTSSNLLYGVSRLQSLNEEVNRILTMGGYVDNYIASGAKKSIIIGADSPMSPNDQMDTIEQFNSFLKDPNTKALMIDTEKLNIKEVSESLASTDVINFLVKLNKQVLESYNLPKFLLGNYAETSNAELVRLSMRIFFQSVLYPEFLRLGRHLTRYAQNILNIKNMEIVFDFDGINLLEDSLDERLKATSEMFKLGLLSPNEARVKLGEDSIDLESMDKHYSPSYLYSGLPVSYENYDQDMEAKLNTEKPSNSSNQDTPKGDGRESQSEDLGGRV